MIFGTFCSDYCYCTRYIMHIEWWVVLAYSAMYRYLHSNYAGV